MSVFPKRVTYGEYLIMHVLFYNNDPTIKRVKATLEIRKNEKKLMRIFQDKNFLVPQKGGIELYYPIKINKKLKPGKYYVSLKMIHNKEGFKSETKLNDFFYIDSFKIKKENKFIFIKNLSKENSPIRFVDNKKIKTRIMKPSAKIKINSPYIIIGNSKIIKVKR